MDLAQLRARTREEHERTESLLPLTDQGLTRPSYLDALRKLYAIVRGWEAWADLHAPERFRALLATRQRSALLVRDLHFFGEQALPAPLAEERFARLCEGGAAAVERPAPCPEAAFGGALYVVEGSTLGGQYIARHAAEVLGLRPGEGNAYFLGYGDHTGSAWREVKDALGALPDDQLEAAVQGARRTFGIFAEGLA